MPQKVEIELNANEAGAVRAWLAVQRSAEGYAGAVGKIDTAQAGAVKTADQHGAAMSRFNKLIRDAETPQQKHNRNLREFGDLLKANKINEEQFATVHRQSLAELSEEVQPPTGGLERFAAVLGGIGVVAGTVKSAGGELLQFMADLDKQAEEAEKTNDTLLRTLRAIAGLKSGAGKEAQKEIFDAAQKRAVEYEDAQGVTESLVSAGMTNKQAQGEGLDATLKFSNAQARANPKEIADAASLFLAGFGKENTGANIEELGVKFQSLNDTKLKVGSLGVIGKEAASVKTYGVSEDETLAGAGILSNSMPVAEGMTQFRNLAQNLSTASKQKDRVDALQQLKLKPADVDMVGE